VYAGRVNALAQYWATPPAQWIGDRSPLRYRFQHEAQRAAAAAPVSGAPRARDGLRSGRGTRV
jgi:hypothetical protein